MLSEKLSEDEDLSAGDISSVNSKKEKSKKVIN